MKIGNREFDTNNHTYIMGILNVTPDSFSDGGQWNVPDQALFRAEQMIEEGVHVIDVGGESARPGYEQVSEEEEVSRVAPVIEAIKGRFDVPVSLDTYKSRVAAEGIKAGADMINDIWGLKYDTDMAKVIADAKVACCLMHNRKEAVYRDLIPDILTDLEASLEIAGRAGIAYDKICLDPGIGFGKTYEQNLMVMQRLEALHALGLPVLLGASRKSVIGLTLGLPARERLEGTLATSVMAVMKGVSFVRVHDVKENLRVIRMAEAIKYAR